ncbi:MAG: porin [Marinobacter sp.]|nr:porin [Marinobacter sp.]
MRKNVLAAAVAATMMAPMAQAISLVDTEESKVDMYGRLVLAVQTFNDDGADTSEFADLGSRIGFKLNHELGNGLTAYGNVEFRFDANEREQDNVFNDLRNSYVGVKGAFGDVRVGNFDSVYFTHVTSVFDIPENEGFVTLDGGATYSRGNSIAYSTSFAGLNLAVQAKHQARDDENGAQKVNISAAASYTMDIFTLGVGYHQDKDRVDGGEDDEILGASVKAALSDSISVYALAETQRKNRDIYALGATLGYGKGDFYTQVAQEDIRGEENLFSYMAGANYFFTSKFYVFGEVYGTDETSDDYVVTAGARLNF